MAPCSLGQRRRESLAGEKHPGCCRGVRRACGSIRVCSAGAVGSEDWLASRAGFVPRWGCLGKTAGSRCRAFSALGLPEVAAVRRRANNGRYFANSFTTSLKALGLGFLAGKDIRHVASLDGARRAKVMLIVSRVTYGICSNKYAALNV